MFTRVNTTAELCADGEACAGTRQSTEDVAELEMYRRQPSLRLSSRFSRPQKHIRAGDVGSRSSNGKKSALPTPTLYNGAAERFYPFLPSSSPSSQEALSQSPQPSSKRQIPLEERCGREMFKEQEVACREDSKVCPASTTGYNEGPFRGSDLRNNMPHRKDWTTPPFNDQPFTDTLRDYKEDEVADAPAVSIGALRRITELEAELREEKNRAAGLSRRLERLASKSEQSPLLGAAPQRAPASPALPTWIGASREDLLSRRLRQTETQLKCAKARASELAGRVEELELTAAATASAAQENLQVCEEQLRRSQNEIHSMRERLQVLERLLEQKEKEKGSSPPILTPHDHKKETLERWEKEIEEQKAALSAESENVEKQKAALSVERESVEREKATLSLERESVEKKKSALSVERESVEKQKDALNRQQQALEAEQEALTKERKRFTEQVAQFDDEKQAHGRMVEAMKAETRLFPQRLVKEQLNLRTKCLTLVKQGPISVVNKETQNAVERIQSLKTRLEAALGTQEVLKQQLTTAQRMAGIGNMLPAAQSMAPATLPEGSLPSGPLGQGKRGISSRNRKTATVGLSQPSVSNLTHSGERSEEADEQDPVNGAASSPTITASAVVCRGQPVQKKMKTRATQERRPPAAGTVKSGAEEHPSPERPASPTGRRRRRKLGTPEEPAIPDGDEAESERTKAV